MSLDGGGGRVDDPVDLRNENNMERRGKEATAGYLQKERLIYFHKGLHSSQWRGIRCRNAQFTHYIQERALHWNSFAKPGLYNQGQTLNLGQIPGPLGPRI